MLVRDHGQRAKAMARTTARARARAATSGTEDVPRMTRIRRVMEAKKFEVDKLNVIRRNINKASNQEDI
jgi:hypothetical protein